MKRGKNMSVREMKVKRNLKITQDDTGKYRLSVEISKEESLSSFDKKRVYRGTRDHLTQIHERNAENSVDKRELYYELVEEKEVPLEEFRLKAVDEKRKQYILDGLLELLYLISEGKMYDIDLNPFNFIVSTTDGRVKIKAFFREDRGIYEITDDWLLGVKKLIGYFLVSDTKFSEDNYEDLRPKDFYNEMEDNIAEQYLKIMRSSTVDQMVKDWFTDKVYLQLKGFQPVMSKAEKPKDVTSLNEALKLEKEETDLEKQERLDQEEQEKEDAKGKKEKGKGLFSNPMAKWGLLLLVGVFVVSILIVKFTGGGKDEAPPEELPDEERTIVNVEEVNEQFYEGLLKAAVQKYDEASKIYKEMTEEDINSLGEDEQVSVYLTYIKAKQYEDALDIMPDGAETMVKYLKSREMEDEILKIESEDPVIVFEKAILDKEWEKVIELREDVRDREERRPIIMKAFVQSGDLEGAIDYIENTDVRLKDDLKKEYNSYAKEKKVKKKEKNKNMKKIDDIKG